MLLNLKEYYRPAAVSEAVALLRRHPEGAALLAGGTELVASGDHRLEAVVDLSGLGLSGIRREGGRLTLGAMTTLAAIETDGAVAELASGILRRAVRQAAPGTIRAAATLGGTLAGAKGGDEIPTVLLALGAKVSLATPGPITLDLAEFLARRQELLQGSVLTHVTVEAEAGARGGLAFVGRTPADRAIVVAAAVVSRPAAGGGGTGGSVARAAGGGGTGGSVDRVAVGGVAGVPVLVAGPDSPLPDGPDLPLTATFGDFRGSAEYRSWVAPVLVRRALAEAKGETQA